MDSWGGFLRCSRSSGSSCKLSREAFLKALIKAWEHWSCSRFAMGSGKIGFSRISVGELALSGRCGLADSSVGGHDCWLEDCWESCRRASLRVGKIGAMSELLLIPGWIWYAIYDKVDWTTEIGYLRVLKFWINESIRRIFTRITCTSLLCRWFEILPPLPIRWWWSVFTWMMQVVYKWPVSSNYHVPLLEDRLEVMNWWNDCENDSDVLLVATDDLGASQSFACHCLVCMLTNLPPLHSVGHWHNTSPDMG